MGHVSARCEWIRGGVCALALLAAAPATAEPPAVAAAERAAAETPPWAPPEGEKMAVGDYAYFGLAQGFILPKEGSASCNREVMGKVAEGLPVGLMPPRVEAPGERRPATFAGAIVRGEPQGEVGRAMEDPDFACAGQALEFLPNGRGAVWDDPDSGVVFSVEPTETWRAASGRYCRRFVARARIEGYLRKAEGTACRYPDRTWEIVG